jgi:hypothetical protein
MAFPNSDVVAVSLPRKIKSTKRMVCVLASLWIVRAYRRYGSKESFAD